MAKGRKQRKESRKKQIPKSRDIILYFPCSLDKDC